MKSLVCIFLLAVGCGVAVGLTREYFFNNTWTTWDYAQAVCKIYYKDLAIINTTEENNRVLQSGAGSHESWIALRGTWTWTSDETASFIWTWPNGEIPYFRNWYIVNTIDYFACGTLSPNQGLWVNYNCEDGRSFYCYRYLILVQENMTWDEAYEYCRTNYTGLASVTSETSLQQLNLETAQTETESVWTGLSFMNGIWFWVSGEQLGNQVSLSSCPALPYRCGSLNNKTNTLENRNCNDRLNFVCYLK